MKYLLCLIFLTGCATTPITQRNASSIHGLKSQLGKVKAEVERNEISSLEIDEAMTNKLKEIDHESVSRDADLGYRLNYIENWIKKHDESWQLKKK